ncbi:hypothetical protein [Mesorhizobium sp.]|uniref:phage head spike fiber domain-containing protein n=1 Tax=Mesorhizobium sp. TaxID=1871066 RepID=UPI000FE2E2B3|nr:hypothetical protein [Mesorhizobium sp.]RWQ12323.1 MAG: hypothetical protein EOR91_01015 [Mesorhizobium sp.]
MPMNRLGLGLGLTSLLVGGGAAQSAAAARFGSRTDGIVLNFADDTFFAETGHYGSARVKDTATPANEYNSHPFGLVTYTTPALKLTRGPTGFYRYQSHNLFLNSAAPVTQSITVVPNATYTMSITGTGSVALSGAAGGTVSAGSPVSFTAGTNTLTCTVTGSPTTAHVRRTPSDSNYVATAGAYRVELPFEWDANGNPLGILSEVSRNNIALWASNFTNAAWVKTNVTAAKTAIGADGVANSGSTLTATANGGTVLQSITSGSAARLTYAFVRRRTGIGTVEMTQDNGATWTAIALTSAYALVSIPSQTIANPIVGFRFGTSGDAIDVWCFQHSISPVISSPIETFSVFATRGSDNISLATTLFPVSPTGMTLGGSFETSKLGNSAVAVEMAAAVRADSAANITVATANNSFVVSGAAGATQCLLAHTPLTTGEFQRIVASAAANDFRSSRDDELTNPDTSGTFQSTAFAKLAIGSISGGTACLEGHIREIFYFPQTATNDELRALSGPVGTTELANSLHFLGDSFLNGIPMVQYVRKRLTDKARSFSKDGIGGTSLQQQAVRFDATSWDWTKTLIIMDGGSSDLLEAAQAAVQSEIAHLTHSRWLFIEGGYDIGTKAAGSPARLVIDSINAWVNSTYPGHFVATKTIMQSYSTGDANDLADLAADVWPRSQTTDGLHPTTTPGGGSDHLSQIIVDAINARGW